MLSCPAYPAQSQQPIIADHSIMNHVRLDEIPDSAIIEAKNSLHIAYGHTSHGSQITTGMTSLPAFKELNGGAEGLYDWHDGPLNGSLDLDDRFVDGDLGNPDRTTWAERTRIYLDHADHEEVNVVMWSWCGQASSASEEDIDTYLGLMNGLEQDYTGITFVYMTGHTDGSGLDGNLHLRNEQIREYCDANAKVLFDFADIESYDPDGNYFGDNNVTDSCNYVDANGTGNWASEWQDAHTEDVDWYQCSAAHSEALNGNMKAYAAWWLWARIAGWSSDVESSSTSGNDNNNSNDDETEDTGSSPLLASPVAFLIGLVVAAVWVSRIRNRHS